MRQWAEAGPSLSCAVTSIPPSAGGAGEQLGDSTLKLVLAQRVQVEHEIIAEHHDGTPVMLGCHAGTLAAIVGEKGDVRPCEILDTTFGNLRYADDDLLGRGGEPPGNAPPSYTLSSSRAYLPARTCALSEGYVTDPADCDDQAASTYPGAPETCGSEVDADCDGTVGGAAALDGAGTLLDPECLLPEGPEAQVAAWIAEGRLEADCAWDTVSLEPGRTVGDLPALGAGSCGRTVRFGDGDYELGAVEIDTPTILVGTGTTTLAASLRVRSGVPLRAESLTLRDAAFPGAVFVAHHEADVTLVDVSIRGASGFGVYQESGVLRLLGVSLEDTAAVIGEVPARTERVAVDTLVPRGPFPLLDLLVVSLFSTWGCEAQLSPWQDAYVYDLPVRVTPSASFDLECLGAGVFVGTDATAEIAQSVFGGSGGPGVAVRGGLVGIADSLFLESGRVFTLDAPTDDNPLLTACAGALHASESGVVVVDGAYFEASRASGILLRDAGLVGANVQASGGVHLPTDTTTQPATSHLRARSPAP